MPELLNHNMTLTDLQVTGEECGSFGFRQHSDLLESQEVMDMDVVLCKGKKKDECYA